MITFIDNSLREKILKAINYYTELGISGFIEDVDFDDLYNHLFGVLNKDDIDLEFSYESEMYFNLYDSEAPTLSLKKFIDITEKVYSAK